MFIFILAVIFLVSAVAIWVHTTKSRKPIPAKIEAYKAEEAEDLSNRNDRYARPKDRSREIKDLSDSYDVLGYVRVFGVALAVAALVMASFSMVFTQGVGQAKVLVNVDGTPQGQKLDPGFGVKAPWTKVVDFDVFQQEVTFAGSGDKAPNYSGGEVSGAEITVSLKGGAQAFVDLSTVYSLDPEMALPIYTEFRSQERFNRQVVIPTILSAVRDVPSAYTPVEFRGSKRGEASDLILERINNKLKDQGIEVSVVNLQDIRFTDQVEESIKQVEVAQQKEETAQAELRATEVSSQAKVVEAQANADARVKEAEGAAEANRLLTESLTAEVLQQNYIEALKNGTVFVVPEGSTPMVNTGQPVK